MIKKGDKSTFKGVVKTAPKDYLMIKRVNKKEPLFIDEPEYRLLCEIFNSADFQKTFSGWID